MSTELCIYNILAELFPMVAEGVPAANTFQISGCGTFVIILLAKTSHVANPRDYPQPRDRNRDVACNSANILPHIVLSEMN